MERERAIAHLAELGPKGIAEEEDNDDEDPELAEQVELMREED